MTKILTEDEYNDRIDRLADEILNDAEAAVEEGVFDDIHTAVHEFTAEDVQHTSWFTGDPYNGARFGAIVEYANDDVSRYSDWESLIESDTPERTLLKLAVVCMEADVTRLALERVEL